MLEFTIVGTLTIHFVRHSCDGERERLGGQSKAKYYEECRILICNDLYDIGNML